MYTVLQIPNASLCENYSPQTPNCHDRPPSINLDNGLDLDNEKEMAGHSESCGLNTPSIPSTPNKHCSSCCGSGDFEPGAVAKPKGSMQDVARMAAASENRAEEKERRGTAPGAWRVMG